MDQKDAHVIKAFRYASLWGMAGGIFFLVHSAACLSIESNGKSVKKYGDVIKSAQRQSDNAIIEEVMIYPKICSGSKQRISRHGILIRHADAKATILMCHGFMCDKFMMRMIGMLFPHKKNLKLNFMYFDFRGHGESGEGQYCTLGRDERYDVMAAGRFLRAHPALNKVPLLVYGFSMGAVAAIEAQAKDAQLFQAMILDCPFDSTENLLKRSLDSIKCSFWGYEFSMPGRSLLQRYAFHPYVQSLVKAALRVLTSFDPKQIEVHAYPLAPMESIKKISVPCFLIQCKHDEKVSTDAAKSLYHAACSDNKVLWITSGRFHFDSCMFNPEKYAEQIKDFLNEFLNGSLQRPRREIREDDDDVAATTIRRV